ncbi:MAG TPA: hypothetical protein VGO63_02440 [Candidatus Paceibacterota bacterium]|nr:hypothetical protein [Candidatus Paceibacterota bacterium]
MKNTDLNLFERVSLLAAEFKKEDIQTRFTHLDIVEALEQFQECVRYLNTRRSKTKLVLDDEAAVQDAIYLILRPWIHDLIPENPTGKLGNKYAFGDFYSKSTTTIVEAKFIRDKPHGKNILKEISEDIELYRQNCDHLIFFLYDPESNIPDGEALKRAIVIERTYDGRRLHCYLIIKP